MKGFMEFINNNLEYTILVMLLALSVSFLWNIILSVKLSKSDKKYKRFMRNSSGKSLENVLEEYLGEVSVAAEKFENVEERLEKLQQQIDKCVQKSHMVRYNAYSDTGSDLSYSIAMLDNYNNGFILTGIFGRNETINYAKPVQLGESKYPLSVEEQMVLDRCIKKGNR